MNKDIGKKWVAALRSGEYTQGQEALARVQANGVTKYCCLGVLCEVAVKEGLSVGVSRPDGMGNVAFDNATAFLPASVQEWAGLEHRNASVDFDGVEVSLSTANDRDRKTFEEIADAIEATFDLAEPERVEDRIINTARQIIETIEGQS